MSSVTQPPGRSATVTYPVSSKTTSRFTSECALASTWHSHKAIFKEVLELAFLTTIGDAGGTADEPA